MQIVTVCRMNQARSPFAQAVLQRNFPEDIVRSSGVAAVNGTPILNSVLAISKTWKVPILKEGSTSIDSDREAILEADLVITAEKSHSESIRQLGFSGSLRSFEEIFEDLDFIPVDPEGLAFDDMSRELGKVGALTLRAAIEAKGFAHAFPITSYIPHGVSDLSMALARAQFERVAQNAILIDGDLRAPNHDGFAELGLEAVPFEIKNLSEVQANQIKSNQVLTHRVQLDYPEAIYLSPEWRQFIGRCANVAPVVMITAPRHSQMRRLPDSYLASYMSDEFGVISS